MSSEARQQFIVKVIEAFQDSEYPEDRDLFSSSFSAESIGMDVAFTDKKWDEISMDVAIKYRNGWTYFTIAAYAYFLPTLLLMLLKHPVEADTVLNEILIDLCPDPFSEEPIIDFNPNGRKSLAAYHLNWLNDINEHLTMPQRSIILEFLLNYKQLFSEEGELYEWYEKSLKQAIEYWQWAVQQASG